MDDCYREEIEIAKFAIRPTVRPLRCLRLQRHYRRCQSARLVLVIMRPRLEDTVYKRCN